MAITNSYISDMDVKETPFSAALKCCLEKTKPANQKKLAAFIGMSQSYVSALKNAERDGSEKTRRKVAEYFNMDYQKFLDFGQSLLSANTVSAASRQIAKLESLIEQSKKIAKTTPESNINIHKQKNNSTHHEIVDAFKNSALAERINHLLLQLERKDEKKLEVFLRWLELEVGGEKENNKGELPEIKTS